MTRLSPRQGFVSAAELASHNGRLAAIGTELDGHGVERSYGNDARPIAEMIALQKMGTRLRYRNAKIDYYARECAVYRERRVTAGSRPDRFCRRTVDQFAFATSDDRRIAVAMTAIRLSSAILGQARS